MSRDEGFAVMDVSTSIIDDPKVKKLWRHAPDHAAAAFTAYVGTLAHSWRSGKRVTIDDAWPAFLPFDKAAVEALVHVGMLDDTGCVTLKAWRSWFGPAQKRRRQARDRWTRYNAKRTGDTAVVPRGNDATTATSVPSVRPSVPTDPSGSAQLRALRAPAVVKEYRRAIGEPTK